jgi:uncharacterized membrane protein HdeD (DUF308 family)
MATHTMPSAPATTGADPDEVFEAERYWYAFALSGVVSLGIGVLVLAYPDPSVELLGLFIGIDLLLVAVAAIVRGVAGLAGDGSSQGTLLIGILGLIAGAVVIRNPGGTVVLLAVTLAIYLIVAGALALAHGLIWPERRLASLAKGLVLVGAGTVMLCWPSPSLNTLVVLAGISLCIGGIVDFAEAFLLRRAGRAERQALPGSG